MGRYLFDRLCQPLLTLPIDESARLAWLKQSIEQELQRLVTHRAFFEGINTSRKGRPTVLNFGIGDLVSRSANFEDIGEIKGQIRQMILHYEPRLLNPQIHLSATNNPMMPATLIVTGTIQEDSVVESFYWSSELTEQGVA
jgi:type VI secretion system lysozyme-like protein